MLRKAGQFENAFELSSRLGDHATIVSLVCETAPRLMAEGRGPVLERWISAVPASQFVENGWLQYWQATATLTTAPALSRAGFESALARFVATSDAAGAYLAWAGGLHAYTYDCRSWHALEGWFDRFAELERLWPAFPSAEVGSQTASALLLGLTLVGAPAETLDHWATRALALAENAADPTVRVLTASVLVLNYALHGDHRRTADLVAAFARESEASPVGLLARIAAKGATAALLWHQGDCVRGLEAARAGERMLANNLVPMWSSALLVCGAWCAFDSTSPVDGQRFRQLLGSIAESGTPLEISSYQVVRAREALYHGDLRTTLDAAQLSLSACRVVGFEYGRTVCLALIAHAAFELSELDEASAALAELLRIANEFRDVVAGYWGALLEADHALRNDARESALVSLGRAFALGREGQLYAMHAPPPQRMALLCSMALEAGIEPEYTQTLIQRRQLQMHPAPLDAQAWPWPLRVRVLGSLEAEANGHHPIAFGQAKMPLLLLKVIVALASDGRSVPVERLAEILWPDADGDRSAKSFEVNLVRLRRVLGAAGRQAIRVERGALRLDTAVCWTDLSALNATLAKIRSGPTEPAGALAARLFELYRGPFGADSEDLPPELLEVQERTRTRFAGAVRELSRRLRQQGQVAAADAICARAIEVDPGGPTSIGASDR